LLPWLGCRTLPSGASECHTIAVAIDLGIPIVSQPETSPVSTPSDEIPTSRDDHGFAPWVTIVTPSFNQGEFIADAIDSVLTQDYPAIDYVVMDGGSTDRTLEVLRGYGDQVRWTSGPDGGQAEAIHRGFLAGKGTYLAWLNSDDRLTPGAVTAAVDELQANPDAALVYGKGEYIDRAGRLIGPCVDIEPWNYRRLLDATDFLLQPATMFRRDAYLAVGGLDPALDYAMDYELWIRLGARYPVRYLPRVLAQARLYGETKTSLGGLARLEEIERMVRRNGGRGLPRNYRLDMWRELRPAFATAMRQHRFRRAAQLGIRICRFQIRAWLGRLRRSVMGQAPSD
jgi:glycosyltransferase involved in cell wall biosynthesis